ncbi:MAG: DUF4446 family protein [Candidatus Moraniibacteriota bacterium]|jgi:uncharacterized protein DUF4446
MTEFYSSNQSIIAILSVIAIILLLVTLIISIINFFRITKLQKEIAILFSGKKGVDLEEILLNNNKKLITLDTEIQELFNISNTINKQSHKGLNKIGLVRFNPFGERAGNQSFALALLNSADDGIVLSSLHTREGTRIYTKEISSGQPVENELTEEEKTVIATAN